MFDIFLNFATDENLEMAGIWRQLAPASEKSPEASVLIARDNNINFQRKIAELYEQNREVLDLGGEAAESKSRELTILALASTILLDFKGISYKRKPMEYTVENAVTLLQHKDFRERVVRMSKERDGYLLKLEEEQGEA